MAEKLKEQTDNQLVPVSYGPSKAVVPLKEVRSDAEVKHGIVHFSTHIAPLRLHTNLNIPPSNWLRSSSKLEQHVHDLTWRSSRKPSEFSSIDMSHKSPDLAGEVDVITHAANIKKLLKIPFENSHISMMVHRVGKSLLLDEFDIHKHLLRKEQTEWAWLRQFYYEYVLDNMKCVPRQSKSRDNLQNRNMYSKFLYHSLCESAESGVCMINQGLMSNEDKTVIPDPLPKAAGSQTHRDVLWTFEDIKMLIGTDLPVFCDDSYCVSLRLSDMRTPVNVLTGLDYWLDNLMCNVPEVAMCFHVNGIVQKYEIVKTEDIPHLENSRFDPTVVTDIAKNILSFLKTNATKEGHTYWLYKGTNDDVVKLYDLTTVCSDMEKNFSEQNPFTVPLGMLLYRVARKMWTDQKLAKTALIRTLLENCLCLLDEKKHSQVCTSASYLLSDIYVPDKSLDDDWSLPVEVEEEENCNEEQGQDTEEVKEMSNSVDVKTLSERSSRSRSKELVRMKPFNETVDERCTEAVKCIHKGLACLEYDLKVGSHKQTHIVEEQAKCDSDTAIPLHYEPLKKTAATDSPVLDTGSSSRTGDLQMTSFNKEGDEQPEGQTWHHLSKGLLYRKAAMTFSAMARGCMNKAEYIEAVKYLKLAMYSLNAMKVVIPHKVSENSSLLSNLMGLCGDIRLVVTQSHQLEIDWDTTWKSSPTEETAILEMAEKEFESFEYEGIFKFGSIVLDSLTVCINCYREAIDLISKKKGHVYLPLCKRKGNCLNELGVFYMQSAQKLLETEVIIDKPSPEMMTCWVKGRQAFSEGIEVFEKIEDIANQALLHCNCGRLMRLCATTYTQIALKSEKQEFTPKERHYFQLAIEEYKKALSLGNQGFKNIVESVRWELSTTYFNMASLLQDYAPLSSVNKEEVENEVTNLMDNSMKYCREDSSYASQPMYQFRMASINHRLASLFHSTVRGDCSEQKKRHLRQLSEKHYQRALKLYLQMECHMEYLRAQLEYIALLERSLTGQSSSRNLKVLHQMLQSLADCQEPLKGLSSQLKVTDGPTNHQNEGETIVNIIEERLQFILQQLVKINTHLHSKKSASRQNSTMLAELKVLYANSLSIDTSDKVLNKLQSKCAFLETFLQQVSNFCHKIGSNQESEVT